MLPCYSIVAIFLAATFNYYMLFTSLFEGHTILTAWLVNGVYRQTSALLEYVFTYPQLLGLVYFP